jgi:hypothetical protein
MRLQTETMHAIARGSQVTVSSSTAGRSVSFEFTVEIEVGLGTGKCDHSIGSCAHCNTLTSELQLCQRSRAISRAVAVVVEETPLAGPIAAWLSCSQMTTRLHLSFGLRCWAVDF